MPSTYSSLEAYQANQRSDKRSIINRKYVRPDESEALFRYRRLLVGRGNRDKMLERAAVIYGSDKFSENSVRPLSSKFINLFAL